LVSHLGPFRERNERIGSAMDDCEEEPVCPLCLEELDLTDRHFKPCQCGYQVCLPASHLWSLCWSRGSVSGIDRCKTLRGRLILDTNLFVRCRESISAAQCRYADGTVHVLAKLTNEPNFRTGLLYVMFELQLGPRLRTVVVQRVVCTLLVCCTCWSSSCIAFCISINIRLPALAYIGIHLELPLCG
jgi:hypothetical protein